MSRIRWRGCDDDPQLHRRVALAVQLLRARGGARRRLLSICRECVPSSEDDEPCGTRPFSVRACREGEAIGARAVLHRIEWVFIGMAVVFIGGEYLMKVKFAKRIKE